MATSSRRKAGGRKSSRSRTARSGSRSSTGGGTDAIALLKADHREVKNWFAEFEKTGSSSRKQDLAQKICRALTAHTVIEEEIFYPAFLEATGDKDIHHEAEVEHEGAKRLIAEIESAGPDDDYFDAKVTVLSEMIKHHVNEEEKRGGMFTKARSSGMDLDEIGDRLRQRKEQVMSGARSGDSRGRGRGMAPAGLAGRDGRQRQQPARASR
ncbi:MAG TPA: hemerythrin domain-containing protein [Gammaproteobacteria bacterium]|nr:hemerythrin domain-containing protein [Gammaproteobacteria bacterium]